MSTIVTRSGKGSPLTSAEVDSNFTNLNTDKAELSGATFTGEITANAGIALPDSQKATFGDGDDLTIFSDGGTFSYINNTQGILRIRNTSDDQDVIIQSDNGSGGVTDYFAADGSTGAAILYNYGSTKLATTSYGVDITGRLVTTSHIDAPDNAKIRLGDSDDLQIYHDGSNSYVKDAGTGTLNLQGSTQVLIAGANGTVGVQFVEGGGVNLRHNNSQKLATTSTGIDVTGTATMDGLTVDAGTGADAVSILRMGSANSGANKSSINFQNSAGSEIFAIDYTNSGTTLDINSDLGGSIFTLTRAGGIVINQDGGDHDVRIESSGNANMLFVDGENDRVGVGTSSPTSRIHLADSSSNSIVQATFENDARKYALGVHGGLSDSFVLYDATAGVTRLSIASDGAATFTSTIAATGATFAATSGRGLVISNATTTHTNSVAVLDAQHSNGSLSFKTAGTERFNIATDGAATFSSTVSVAGVGVVGATDGDLNIYSTTASHGGLRLGNGYVGPTNNAGTITNDAISLGLSGQRFTNLYLSDSLQNSGKAGSASVFNEDGTTADFRVESDGNDHAIYVDGANNSVTLGSSSSAANTIRTQSTAGFQASTDTNFITTKSYTFRDGVGMDNPNASSYSTATAAVLCVGAMTSGRSINATGTINASGADYAEYEANNGLVISKGSIVGFNADGVLTLTFSEAVRFAVKSTDPAYVGGDTWSDVEPPEKNTTAWDTWFAEAEAKRAKVDRVAYSGKVPVNVQGATAGQYIIAVANSSGEITGQAVTDPDFSQYKLSVGRVNRILEDGRAELAVIIH
jgi:hypothetical protein